MQGFFVPTKTLGGVGSILLILGIVPFAGSTLEIVGFVLMLIAVKYSSDALNNKAIFNNAIISIAAGIAGVIVGVVVVVAGVLSFFGPGMFQGNMTPRQFQPSDFLSMNLLGPITAGVALI